MSHNRQDAINLITSVLQREYGDAALTSDRKVAAAVRDALLEAGWFPPEDVRSLVASMGGRVEVSAQAMADPPNGLRTWRNPETCSVLVETYDE